MQVTVWLLEYVAAYGQNPSSHQQSWLHDVPIIEIEKEKQFF